MSSTAQAPGAVIVTGGSRGIGAAVAVMAGARGYPATAGAPDRPARMAPGIPMRRSGTPEEVAEAVLWLLSPAAAYVTGTIVEVGGGR